MREIVFSIQKGFEEIRKVWRRIGDKTTEKKEWIFEPRFYPSKCPVSSNISLVKQSDEPASLSVCQEKRALHLR